MKFQQKIVIFILLLINLEIVNAQEILIFGGRNNKEFLGCLTCNEMSGDSVWNEMSQFGWNNNFGKWNSFGEYKNSFSSYSACNEFTSSAPVLVDKQGNFYGRLTINEFAQGSICSISGNQKICMALKVMCKQ